VADIKEKREKAKRDKEIEAALKYEEHQRYIRKAHELFKKERLKKIVAERARQIEEFKKGGYSKAANKKGSIDQMMTMKSKNQTELEAEQNLRMSMDILTQMDFKDFNMAGDKAIYFSPSSLLREKKKPRSIKDDESTAFDQQSMIEEQEEFVDDVRIRSKLPKPEDFLYKPVPEKKKRIEIVKPKDMFEEKLKKLKEGPVGNQEGSSKKAGSVISYSKSMASLGMSKEGSVDFSRKDGAEMSRRQPSQFSRYDLQVPNRQIE